MLKKRPYALLHKAACKQSKKQRGRLTYRVVAVVVVVVLLPGPSFNRYESFLSPGWPPGALLALRFIRGSVVPVL